jgi:CHAT domain-containing protein/tetratricopeptide (TPR) repeat protein
MIGARCWTALFVIICLLSDAMSMASGGAAARPALPAVAQEVAILTDAIGRVTLQRPGAKGEFPTETLMGLGEKDVLTLADRAEAVVVFNTGFVGALAGPGTFVIAPQAVQRTAPRQETVALRGAAGDAGLPLTSTQRLAALADAAVTRKGRDDLAPAVPYRDVLSDRPTFRWTSTRKDPTFTITLFKDDAKTILHTLQAPGRVLEFPKDWEPLKRGATYYWRVADAEGKAATDKIDFFVIADDDAKAVENTLAAIRQSFGTSVTGLRLTVDHLLAKELYADALPYAQSLAEAAPRSSRPLLTLKAVYKALEMEREAKQIDAQLKALAAGTPPATQPAAAEKGVGSPLCEAPEGPARTGLPTPFFAVGADLERARRLIEDGRYEDARLLIGRIGDDLARDTSPAAQLDRARALKLAGILHYRLGAGAAKEALAFYQRALAVLDGLLAEKGVGSPLCEAPEGPTGKGLPTPFSGDHLRLDAQREAVRIRNDLGELFLRTGESRALEHAPNAYLIAQDYRTALTHFESAVAAATEIDDRPGLSDTRSNLAGFYRSFGDFYQLIQGQNALAEQYYNKALAEHEAALAIERLLRPPRPINLGRNELGIGNTLFRRGRFAEAESAYARAAAAFKDQAEPFYAGLESAYRNLGLTALAQRTGPNDSAAADRAIEHLKLAAVMSAHLRTQITPGLAGRFRASLFSDRVYVYEKLVELLVERGQTEAAFAYAEEAKARAFLDLLGPDPAAADPAPPVPLEQVRTCLDPKTALVEYLVGRDAAFVFVLFNGRLTVDRLKVESGDLVRRVALCRATIARMGFTRTAEGVRLDPVWQDQLADLYGLLVAPIQPRIQGAERLVIVPHHILHYLPFGALVTRPEKDPPSTRFAQPAFLVEAPIDIAYAPSAGALYYARRHNTGSLKRALILANAVYPAGWPALPGAEREAQAVAPLFSAKLLIGQGATEAALKAAASPSTSYEVLYLATHGKLDAANPLRSHLLLTPTANPLEDGELRAEELFALGGRLRANLVVLSACQSGLGEPSPQAGDDLVGLSRAFMAAGSPSVVATLWNVSDRTSAILMVDFFKGLTAGADKARALADAQRTLIANARRDSRRDIHPFYWAPFVLVGDLRASVDR